MQTAVSFCGGTRDPTSATFRRDAGPQPPVVAGRSRPQRRTRVQERQRAAAVGLAGAAAVLVLTTWFQVPTADLLRDFVFGQPGAADRLSRVRTATAIVVGLLVALGPYGRFYVDTADLLYTPGFPFHLPALGRAYLVLRGLVVLSAVLAAAEMLLPVSTVVLAVAFALLNYYVSRFGTTLWITNTHLNLCLVLVAFAGLVPEHFEQGAPDGGVMASYLVAAMQLSVGLIYFQAGLSKAIYGGVRWFTTGQSIYVATLLHGTRFGRSLTRWPWIFRGFGVVTALVEFGFIMALPFPEARRAAVIAAILFHLGTFAVMRISFWFLWTLYPALFF